MEGRIAKALNRLPEGFIRTFLKDHVKYFSVAIAVATGYWVAKRLYRVFLGPTSNIPGNFIDNFFNLPMIYYSWPLGTRYKYVAGLHRKYGSIVRSTGRSISVADKHMIKQILHDDDVPKANGYKNFQFEGNQTLFNTIDKSFHKTRRRVVSPAFSVKSINALETYMNAEVNVLMDHIRLAINTANQHMLQTAEIDMWKLLQCTALDVIGSTAFDQSFEMVKTGQHPLPKAISDNLSMSALQATTASIPIVNRLVTQYLKRRRVRNIDIGEFMISIIEQRLKSGKRKNDILQILIDTQQAELKNDRLDNRAIIHENILFLVAGSETTSNTIGFAITHLIESPETLRLLQQELDEAYPRDVESVLKHEDLKNLPYLNGVINETMRLKPVAMGGLPRQVHSDYVLGGKYHIPKGMLLNSNIYCCQTNPEYWPEPLAFKPERWLPGSDIPADKDAFFPFSSGSRNCIGQNFAMMEMRLILASFVYNFNIEPVTESVEALKDLRQYITYTIASNSYKVRVSNR
ncbi:hypothetical protein INT43_004498 [Umbelopsis isabellina]|uniref:Cytochrome P450 n=1 Tax=Mortierella isabellina TaxID=91625 RepID=A0A8H7PG85_MORIS|nr:hypothetical protein INT43_004498 [Umbelopsis isabellina]